MRMSIIVGFVICLSGCATYAPYTYQEQCAFKGMKLAGVNADSGRTTHVTYGRNSPIVGTSDNYSESVRCDVPASDDDRKMIGHIHFAAGPKIKYNSTVEIKRWVNGAGYILFIIPGIGLKLVFDNEQEKAIKESESLYLGPPQISAR